MYPPSNTYEQEILAVGPFAGLDYSSSPYYVDANHATDMLNVVPEAEYGSFYTATGRIRALSAAVPGTSNPEFVGGEVISSMAKGWLAGTSPGIDYVFGSVNSNIYKTNMLTGSPTIFYTGPGIGGSYVPLYSFKFYGGYLYFCFPYNPSTLSTIPQEYDGSLSGPINWQIAPPTTAPAGTEAGAGTGAMPIGTGFYCYTFLSGTIGQFRKESSPSPFSASIATTFANDAINLTGIAVSTDTQVTARNIYRIGWGSGVTQLVATINDNTTTTFQDQVSTLSITGQTLIPHQDVPQNFYATAIHKERLWGFGYSGNAVGQPTGSRITGDSDLWYSDYGVPWAFDNVNQIISLNRQAGGYDIAVGLASIGSILLCFKTHAVWAVSGSTPNDFSWTKLFDTGCVSQKSIVSADGVAYWLSEQGVFSFDGNTPKFLSNNIQTVLNAIASLQTNAFVSDIAQAVGYFRNQRYGLSFPTLGITYEYSTITNEWYKLGWACDNAIFDLENNEELTVTEVVTPNVYTGWVDSAYSSFTDLGNTITGSWKSRTADGGAIYATKRWRHILIQAPVQANTTATVQLTVDPGTGQKFLTRSVSLANGPQRLLISLPPNMVGFTANLQLLVSAGNTAQAEVQKIAAHGWIERQYLTR